MQRSRSKGGDLMSYGIEWTAGPVALGAALLLLLVPGFALIAVVVLALAALAALVALAGAILASPYLLVRTLRRRHAEREESTVASASNHTGVPVLAEPTTASS
jgi:Flp pilus assembly protein TadB